MVERSEIAQPLTDLLEPYLRVTPTGGILPLPAWTDIPNEARVLLYLAARQAIHYLAIADAWPNTSPYARPRLIEIHTGIPGGSIRPALRRLLAAYLAVKTAEGYSMPVWAIQRAQQYVRQWTSS